MKHILVFLMFLLYSVLCNADNNIYADCDTQQIKVLHGGIEVENMKKIVSIISANWDVNAVQFHVFCGANLPAFSADNQVYVRHTTINTLTQNELLFVVLHEYGHIAHQHEQQMQSAILLARDMFDAEGQQYLTRCNHSYEFDADAFAVSALKKLAVEVKIDVVLHKVLDEKLQSISKTHPSISARAEKFL